MESETIEDRGKEKLEDDEPKRKKEKIKDPELSDDLPLDLSSKTAKGKKKKKKVLKSVIGKVVRKDKNKEVVEAQLKNDF